MLPALRKKLKNVSSKSQSLQDILRTCRAGKEAITIKPIQSFFGSKPKKAIFILRYAYNIIAR